MAEQVKKKENPSFMVKESSMIGCMTQPVALKTRAVWSTFFILITMGDMVFAILPPRIPRLRRT
jgi:hypothetical protein